MDKRIVRYVAIGFLALAYGCGGGGGSDNSTPAQNQNPITVTPAPTPTPTPTPTPDTTPNIFSFAAQSGAALSTVLTSNEVSISGIDANASVSISGGEYSIDGAAFTAAAGNIANNQKIKVRVTSSAQFSTTASAVLTVGGVSGTFSVTTLDKDITPDAFQFQSKGNATRGSVVVSNSVTISGINAPAPISIVGGEYSIAGGAFTSTAGTISSGQSLVVRATASSIYSKIVSARVTVGSLTVNFDVMSELPNYAPSAVVYDGQNIVYLLDNTDKIVLRWSIQDARYLDAYVLATAPAWMTYSSDHQRLYLGYSTGTIRYLDTTSSSPTETQFANTPLGVNGLAAVGKFVLAQDYSGAWATHYVFDKNGAMTDHKEWNYYSREYAWDATTSRVYFFRDNMSPDDLHYEVIDQGTGLITSAGETPYHGAYVIQPPIRVSVNGQYVLLGSGDIYNQSGLTWAGSLGSQVTDARWFANGSIVALTTASNKTTLRRLNSSNLVTLEQLTFNGTALRVVGTDAKMVVIASYNNTVQFYTYVPNDDSDGDGVPNTQDAFPLDPAASVDSDGDGYPDAWNPGKTQNDSTTGLALDAYPHDSACFLPSHGDGVHCNYGATVPNYAPDQVINDGDTIYLLSSANKRVYRWSIAAGGYVNPYVVGINQGFTTIAPTLMAYSSDHKRLYLGYSTGAIRYIDVTANSVAEVPFANTALGVAGLAAVGKYVLAQDYSGAWATHYVFDKNGAVTDQKEWNYYSREYAWDAVTSRVYFFRDNMSPNDLQYEVIDQGTGKIASAGETPYHGDYVIQPPIRVSANGQSVLLGSGDIYASPALTWSKSLGAQISDARWFANGSLVALTTGNSKTSLRRLSSNLVTTLEQVTYNGQALRVVGSDAKMVVLAINNGTVQFYTYVPNDDTDGDGVPNVQDAFPLDPAASVDTDGDGYPDAWNPGKTQNDSTTGLVLDAFPHDSACYLASHGVGGQCNYSATVPNFMPDQIVHDGDIVYLLSSANKRVYRWSIAAASYINPYVVGINQGFTTAAPTKMAYSSNDQRLYLGYVTGAIQYIDVTSSSPTEIPFASISNAVGGLAAAGKYLLAPHYLFDSNGVLTDSTAGTYYSYYSSSQYVWDPVTSRIYYFRDGLSPNDLLYQTIDQTTGKVTSSSETPYHGAYIIAPPIRPSVNGQYVLLGSGDIYNQSDLTWAGSLGMQITDARWFANGTLVTLTTGNNQTTLRRLGTSNGSINLVTLEQLTYSGQALRVVGSDAKMVVIVSSNGGVKYYTYVPNDDSDGDGVPNTQDAFPLDPAASVDTDGDGYPDAWNPGKTQNDSTTGLTLDAYPNDSACYLPSHGDGVHCNYGATIPNYVPDQVINDGDVIYLLSSANKRVYRWSIATGGYINPYVVGINQGFSTLAPTKMAYSSDHKRLYLGYGTGAIRYIDVTSNSVAEIPFGNTALAVNGLAAVGKYVLAQDASGAWATHYVFDKNGARTDQKEWNYYSREYAWDPVNSRVYFFRDDQSPDDLQYEVIDQGTGKITAAGETPYHGSYNILPPIRVSASGQYVLLGSGDIYQAPDLTWAGSLGSQVADARWFANGSLVTVTTGANQTTLRRLGANNLTTLEQLTYSGQALRIVGSDTKMIVLAVSNSTVQFYAYVPNDDSDGDGVPNTQDAFPLDPAASVDTDGDGYPDAWNPGKTQNDSTTGLTLDAYPNDSACYLPSHGDGVHCNYGATIPSYIPDQVLNDGDTVYLLSSVNKRVYRWSIATGGYVNPYVVGINQGFTTLAPTKMAYSSDHKRLYLGYSTGAIRYIDVTSNSFAEVPFGNTALGVNGLAAVGKYLLAQDDSGAWATHYVFDKNGAITDQQEWNYYSREYAWDPVNSRVYFFRDDQSPDDLHYEVIDQTTGKITAAGETPYHGQYDIEPPIRVSPDGQYVLLGSGDVYLQPQLTWYATLGQNLQDATWKDGYLIDLNKTDLVEIRDADSRVVLKSYQYVGTQPIRMVFGPSGAYLVHVVNGTTAFVKLAFDDQDQDGLPKWWEQLYGLSDSNPADALGDLDGDGVSNLAEYQNHTNPLVADTDSDGLTDYQEIFTYFTNPTKADSDGDGLSDKDEVLTYHTDPKKIDSDGDGYSDRIELLYGGDPNDVTVLPQPLANFSETFESNPTLTRWATPQQSNAPWTIDSSTAHGGTKSLKSGVVGNSQNSAIRLDAPFLLGTLSFYTKADTESCCDRLVLLVDGAQVLSVPSSTQWTLQSVQIAAGLHAIEWRYQKDSYGAQGADAVWIDDVVFAKQ